ncbi:MAG: hypothetical protein ACRDDY_11160 [Clostridium sp.]|uniref:hypothetical protein n=1 Tax=Clostridium sp. TaxID=1506 RepID=UPI003EE57195
MKKGGKVIIGIVIAIIIIVVAIFAVYYISFRPKASTTLVNTASSEMANASLNKLTPEYINTNGAVLPNGNKQVTLSGEELSNIAAYEVSQSPSISKYVTGVKVEPNGNNEIDVYVTGELGGVSSQAKLEFEVQNQQGNVVLEYEDGKVGFVDIPESKLFDRLRDNSYIKVNRANDSIAINSNAINGQTLVGMNVNGSNLNLEFKA